MPIDPNEAPAGFTAVPKNTVPGSANICRACDWRSTCQHPATDFTAPGNRCMPFPVVTPDGRTIARKDGASVVFKRAQPFSEVLE